jgi:signal transduction histidine kinase
MADSGIGIDPKYHALIFDKFYRVGSAALHSTSTTKFMGGGPGLGLPVAKGVIERHGGRIWVESPGHDPEKFPGSRFHILLPVKPPAFDPRALAQAQGKKEVTTIPGQKPFIGIE